MFFHNGSTITVVPASENGRGYRSSCCIREEFRQIDKNVDDSILSPFQTIRQAPYMLIEPYSSDKSLQEEPVDIYISSSWVDDGHWMWDIVDQAYDDMMNGGGSCLLAFDESITLKHNIKTLSQLKKEKKKQDPLTWRIEFLNERVKENMFAFFTYQSLFKNQVLKKPFYPRTILDYRNRRKNPHNPEKHKDEIRIVSCDMAFIEGRKNDNSIFSCIRLLPESVTYRKEDNSAVEIKQGYRRAVSYIESIQGGDTGKQAIRIRQLYNDFDADYIVLDIRNAGISVYDALAKIMYDEERDVEYAPLSCMNDENIANRIKTAGANPVIFVISATQGLNSEIALTMRNTLQDNQIDFLINYNNALEDILPNIDEYKNAIDLESQLFYEKPYHETFALIDEMTNLMYEKNKQTGTIRVFEHGSNKKDRYISVAYGNHFASLLEQDLLSTQSDYEHVAFAN